MIAYGEGSGSKNATAIHASVVSINGWSVAICGISGAGKSDLALRLIDRGATLVGDDYVRTHIKGGQLLLQSVPEIAGKIEVRGIGIVTMPYIVEAPLRLVVCLGFEGERLPANWPVHRLGHFAVPALYVAGFYASTPLKVELALKSVVDADMWPVPSAVQPLPVNGTLS